MPERRVCLCIEYDGTNYSGWQRQINAISVQQVLEEKLALLTRRRVVLHAASRTDAGVHALRQFAHFDTDTGIPDEKICYAINTMLPPDIRVVKSYTAGEDFHARFSAAGKIYAYRIYNAPHMRAYERYTRAHVPQPLDISRMTSAARDIIGTHDFAAFQASGSKVTDTVRTMYDAKVECDGGDITIYVYGRGFLYNMVRIFAGTLIDIGRNKLPDNAVRHALTSRDRLTLGYTAPACGLTLVTVCYGEQRYNINDYLI